MWKQSIQNFAHLMHIISSCRQALSVCEVFKLWDRLTIKRQTEMLDGLWRLVTESDIALVDPKFKKPIVGKLSVFT